MDIYQYLQFTPSSGFPDIHVDVPAIVEILPLPDIGFHTYHSKKKKHYHLALPDFTFWIHNTIGYIYTFLQDYLIKIDVPVIVVEIL